ncbi:MAG TPA: pyruvate, phosphate dikinase [Firmicutes bacterium]|nr:pyruvate, phosphate dikinase [Bacillota bacterium]
MQYVYSFKEGNKDQRNLLGGKGANLAEMSRLGLPIPSGFIVTTDACHEYYKNGEVISSEIQFQILSKLKALEASTGKIFGDPKKPLLVSVRSGAPVSMPGMMDSIMNLGMNDAIAEEMAKSNPRMAWDSYRRFIEFYSEVVMGYPTIEFAGYLEKFKETKGYKSDLDLSSEDLRGIVLKYKDNYLSIGGEHFPEDPKTQLMNTIAAVFKSWNNDRAKKYRKLEGISEDIGTAVNVQEMVYGNMNDRSGTGVLFSRNPATGVNELSGEYLLNAQGEDIVSGIRTPSDIKELKDFSQPIYDLLYRIAKSMEKYYRDVQDMEFTIENDKLYILQTRIGKRTPEANVKFALDFMDEGIITEKEALLRIKPGDLEVLLRPSFSEESLKTSVLLTKGLAASPGVAVGHPVFKSDEAKRLNDKNSILVRNETSAEDIDGMIYANGILTKNGGLTSHAAVVARGFGECAVCGASALKIDEENETLTIGDKIITREDYISIDGSTGAVYLGKLELSESSSNEKILQRVLDMSSKYETINVRANADTPEAAKKAIDFGADGIGLVRTEHMFFEETRILEMRKMILAKTDKERSLALSKLEEFQENDFYKILKVMGSHPVIIRYLDPPLHEFLPKEEEEIQSCATSLGIYASAVESRMGELKEVNPMMGFRGCRLGVKYPEISIMQTRAIIKALIRLKNEGIDAVAEMMVPLTTDLKEYVYIKNLIDKTARDVMKQYGMEVPYKVGTMIETPRAALMSQLLSKYSDFYSFGTNDLTQLTYGLSRDDAGKFLDSYYDKNIYEFNPFETLDINGVGVLMEIAKSTAVKEIEMGICGEHGGEQKSIEFAYKLGLDYVSCSPYRIPSARLISAQASIREKANK